MHNSLGRQNARGWPNQLDDQALLNFNYEYRRKLWTVVRTTIPAVGRTISRPARKWVSASSPRTRKGGSSTASAGTCPKGLRILAIRPRSALRLIRLMHPLAALPERTWRPYFSVVARVRSLGSLRRSKAARRKTAAFIPRLESVPGDEQLLFGIHVNKAPLAFHLTYYLVDDEHFSEATRW